MRAPRLRPSRSLVLLWWSAALGLLFLTSPLPAAAAGGGGGGGGGGMGQGGASMQRAAKHFERAEKYRVQGIEDTRLALKESDPEKRAEQREDAQRDFKRALREYKKAIRAKRDFHYAYNGQGFCQRMLGDYEAALASYDKALELAPGFPPAVEYRAEAYLRLGRLKEAQAAYMELFNAERKIADLLMRKMRAWLAVQQTSPSVPADELSAFQKWVDERSEIAAQTAALLPGEADSRW
ncbi:MAG: tetratricopeptide repeat protein [Myxococcota bacterium]